MTNQEARDKFDEVVKIMEEASKTRNPNLIAQGAGLAMPKMMKIILHLMEKIDVLNVEIERLKTPQWTQYNKG